MEPIPDGRRLAHAVASSNRRICTMLYAAAVKVKNPAGRVGRRDGAASASPPIVFIQPKPCSTSFRFCWLIRGARVSRRARQSITLRRLRWCAAPRAA